MLPDVTGTLARDEAPLTVTRASIRAWASPCSGGATTWPFDGQVVQAERRPL